MTQLERLSHARGEGINSSALPFYSLSPLRGSEITNDHHQGSKSLALGLAITLLRSSPARKGLLDESSMSMPHKVLVRYFLFGYAILRLSKHPSLCRSLSFAVL